MAVLKRKTKMISLRLSPEEYEALRSLYRVHGSRSVSEFARTAMQRVIAETVAPQQSLEGRIQELNSKMALIDHDVARLVSLLENRIQAPAALSADAA
ncbi:hypothetical protein [Nevskia soli]|jgi:uncharacterized protein (DUF1778 family)|uniref:hypothetical protein n=1 Tax=Nevskia soli TaxID=418856 RepID=UPI0015D8C5A0|nr:hypothetical protein [Nevskia soli]